MQHCVVCGEEVKAFQPFRSGLSADQGAGAYSIVLCPFCGSGHTEPQPTPAELSRRYDGYGSRPIGAQAAKTGKIDPLARMRQWWGLKTAPVFFSPRGGGFRVWRMLLSSFVIPRTTLMPLFTDVVADRVSGRALRLLDVGCGSGEFLQFASSAGVEAVGLELGDDAAIAGQSMGLDVRAGTIQSLRGAAQCFDVVRFSHVLEHVFTPEEDLRLAHDLLGKGGYLLVAVPQIPSAVTVLLRKHAWYHLPFHLHHFSRRGLTALLAKTGFRVLHVRSKSNSMLIQSLARAMGKPELSNSPGTRLLCIAIEMVLDALGCGDSIEIHAVAR